MRLNKRPSTNYIQCTEETKFSGIEVYYIKNEEGKFEPVEEFN